MLTNRGTYPAVVFVEADDELESDNGDSVLPDSVVLAEAVSEGVIDMINAA